MAGPASPTCQRAAPCTALLRVPTSVCPSAICLSPLSALRKSCV